MGGLISLVLSDVSFASFGHSPSMGGNVTVLLALWLFDTLVAKRTLGESSTARWFAVHAFANFIVVITSTVALFSCLSDPIHCGDPDTFPDTSAFGASSPWPILTTNSVHVYHLLAFKLSASDIFHHLMFIPTIGFMGQFWAWGPVRNALAFFISGLPGGIDYFNLVLTKTKRMKVIRQKRICAALNCWVRGPGLIIFSFVLYQGLIYGTTPYVPKLAIAIIALLNTFNGMYYLKQSVANYAITHALGYVSERISLTTGMRVPIWGKEAKEPQNTMS